MGDKTIWERGGNNVWTIMCGEGGIAQFGMGKTVWDCGIWMEDAVGTVSTPETPRSRHNLAGIYAWREEFGGKDMAAAV